MSVDYAEVARLVRLGRRAEKRGKAVEGCISALIVKVGSDLLGGLYLMLAVGIAHAEWIHKLPTIGYWWAVLMVVLVRPAFASVTSPKKKE
jgi:hypothetical protein